MKSQVPLTWYYERLISMAYNVTPDYGILCNTISIAPSVVVTTAKDFPTYQTLPHHAPPTDKSLWPDNGVILLHDKPLIPVSPRPEVMDYLHAANAGVTEPIGQPSRKYQQTPSTSPLPLLMATEGTTILRRTVFSELILTTKATVLISSYPKVSCVVYRYYASLILSIFSYGLCHHGCNDLYLHCCISSHCWTRKTLWHILSRNIGFH